MGKNILVIGVGGTGSVAVDLMFQKQRELGNQAGNTVRAIVLDTDSGDMAGITAATILDMTDDCKLGQVVDRFNLKALEDWFPCYQGDMAEKYEKEDGTKYRDMDMSTGANQWRKKSFLAFLNMMEKEGYKFDSAMDEMVGLARASEGGAIVEIYVVASLAGGTGSGSFLPIAFYVKRYFERNGVSVKMRAILACPDIYVSELTSSMQLCKINANAYAILRELNAITEVAYGHNKPNNDPNSNGKNMIRFKLGHEDLPVGVLFDAEDPYYWNTGVLPFGRVYLLDKLPNVTSIPAHNGIMANTLYNLVCTEVALAFDSVENNDDPDLVNEGNHNAIYSGISSSELRYPLESIVDYIAYKKTEESAEGEWLTIYHKTESALDVLRERAAVRGLTFEPTTSLYAEEVFKVIDGILKVQRASMSTKIDPLIPILERGLYDVSVEDGQKKRSLRTAAYIEKIEAALAEELKCPVVSKLKERTPDGTPVVYKNPGMGKRAKNEAKEKVASLVSEAADEIRLFYKTAVATIRDNARAYINGILPLDGGDYNANEGFSLVANLLMRDGRFIHPVSAFAQLCDLRREIDKYLEGFTLWQDIESFEAVGPMPDSFFHCGNTLEDSDFEYEAADAEDSDGEAKKLKHNARVGKSAYAKMGENRFVSFLKNQAGSYFADKTDVTADCWYIAVDIDKIYDKISKMAKKQFICYVLSFISKSVDVMIDQYRRFFENFEEKKAQHSLNVEAVLHSNEGKQDTMYIGASADAKIDAYEKYIASEGLSSSLKQIDDASGKSVVDIAYAACCAAAEKNKKKGAREAKVDATSVFSALVSGYREIVKESKFYETQKEKGMFELLVDEAMRLNPGMQESDILPAITPIFTKMYKSAEPSLQVSKGIPYAFMLLPQKSAEYLREKATAFGLLTTGFVSPASLATLSPLEREKQSRRELSALADQFIKKCKIAGLKVRLAQNIPSNVIYLTRKINQITPLMLWKVNETEREPVFFQNYCLAISEKYRNNNDTWNPHLGMELHKHGYLPFINVEYEKDYDTKVCKALLYMIMFGRFSYQIANREHKDRVFYYRASDGQKKPIRFNKEYVTEDNICNLIKWLRNEDQLVDEYAEEYDKEVAKGLADLPIVNNPAQVGQLMRKITLSTIVTKMRNNLFSEVEGVTERDKRLNVGLLAFAWNVKWTEEAIQDSGDGEKILKVGYDTVRQFMEHRIPVSRRTTVISSHSWQVKKFIWAYGEYLGLTDEEAIESETKQVFDWANSNMCFRMIDIDSHEDPDETWGPAPVSKAFRQKRERGSAPESYEEDATTTTDSES